MRFRVGAERQQAPLLVHSELVRVIGESQREKHDTAACY